MSDVNSVFVATTLLCGTGHAVLANGDAVARMPGETKAFAYKSDFSSAADEWKLSGNFGNRVRLDFAEQEGGPAAVVSRNPAADAGYDTAWELEGPRFAVEGGKFLAFRLRTRSTVSMLTPVSYHGGGKTCLRFFDKVGNALDAYDVGYGFPASVGWTNTVVGCPVPAAAASARLYIGADSPNIRANDVVCLSEFSAAYADPARFPKKDEKPPTVELVSSSPGADVSADVRFEVADASPIDWASLSCTLDGVDVTAALQRVGNTLVYHPQRPFAPCDVGGASPLNIHRFAIKVADVHGNVRTCERCVSCEKPAERGVATLRDDGFVLIDGKPFFPIGVYALVRRACNGYSYDRAFRDLKAAGFNLAHSYCGSYGAEFEDMIDKADRHGFKMIVNPGVASNKCEVADRVRRHPSVLSWYLGDDTSVHTTPEAVLDDHRFCQALDNAHLTSQADGTGEGANGSYNRFVGSTDVFLPEIYPVQGEDNPTAAATVKWEMRTIRGVLDRHGREKSIWPIIGYFHGWGTKRFPTFEELRVMSYLAIIHGARGITWYTYGGIADGNRGFPATPETWRNICTVAGELSALQDDLTSRDAPTPAVSVLGGPQKDPLGFPSVTALLKTGLRTPLLLAANASLEPVKACIDIRGQDRAEPLFGGAEPVVENGRLTETFPPLGVRVYRLRK